MSIRHLCAAAAAALLGVVASASPAAARVLEDGADPTVSGWTFARGWASAAALLGLAAVVAGGLALRSVRGKSGGGRKAAVVAMVAGLIAVIVGALNLAVADGGPGTGNGTLGGAAAVVAGLVGLALGALATARSRRTV